MSKGKLAELLRTLELNYRGQHYDKTQTFAPFKDVETIVNTFHQAIAASDGNRDLSAQGKASARQAAGKIALEGIAKFSAAKIPGLDADVATKRAALFGTLAKPDPAAVNHMRGRLANFTPAEIAVLYNSADDNERVLLEHASTDYGRMPVKSERGLEWNHMISPDVVQDSQLSRAAAKSPAFAQQLSELQDIRALHQTVANHAAAEIEQDAPQSVRGPRS